MRRVDHTFPTLCEHIVGALSPQNTCNQHSTHGYTLQCEYDTEEQCSSA